MNMGAFTLWPVIIMVFIVSAFRYLFPFRISFSRDFSPNPARPIGPGKYCTKLFSAGSGVKPSIWEPSGTEKRSLLVFWKKMGTRNGYFGHKIYQLISDRMTENIPFSSMTFVPMFIYRYTAQTPLEFSVKSINYLRQGGNVFARLCLSVCLSVC